MAAAQPLAATGPNFMTCGKLGSTSAARLIVVLSGATAGNVRRRTYNAPIKTLVTFSVRDNRL